MMTMIICVYSLPYSMPLFHMNNETDCVYVGMCFSSRLRRKKIFINVTKTARKRERILFSSCSHFFFASLRAFIYLLNDTLENDMLLCLYAIQDSFHHYSQSLSSHMAFLKYENVISYGYIVEICGW
ncbi:hypothetical protein ACKWTF_008246 [Chironomus riparius]